MYGLLTPNVVWQYSTYGHVAKLAEAEMQGIKEAGGSADIYQYAHDHLDPFADN